MNKINFILVFLFFIGKIVFSQNQTLDNSLLWKIEGENIKNEVYLFGTMHMIEKEYFFFPKSLEKVIKKVDVIVTEINLNELNNQAELLPLLSLENGVLFDFFNQEQQDSIYFWAKNKLFFKKEMFDASFSKMKPFVLVQTATQLEFMGKTESYEMKIKELGDKYKKQYNGFETVKEQLSFFDNLPKESQAKMVMESTDPSVDKKNQLKKMQELYSTQNLTELEKFMKEEGGEMLRDEAVFLTNRNKNWIPKIEKHVEDQNVFIAVGAAHLVGENGLINLLRTKGYTLKPIKL